MLEIGHERDFFEAAFPELSPVWLDTEEASDQLLLLTREQLKSDTRPRIDRAPRQGAAGRRRVCCTPGERVGIVGKNGAGKSTLFALLTGEIDRDAGDLSLPAGWRIASVEQEIHADERPAREFVIDGDTICANCRRAAPRWATTRARRSPRPRRRWWKPAPGARPRAPSSCWPAWASSRRNGCSLCRASPAAGACAALARALMAPSELLLLDEPTNHLDRTPCCGWRNGWRPIPAR